MAEADSVPVRGTGAIVLGIVLLAILLGTSSGRGAARRFLDSLRIARPDPVTAVAPGANGDRQVQGLIGGMLSAAPVEPKTEAAFPVADSAAASEAAGFPVALPGARTDAPSLSVLGAQTIDVVVDRDRLLTVLAEAGRSNVPVPAELGGTKVSLRTPRGARAQYGHCPVADTTLQGQLQGPPQTTPENQDCVILTEVPEVAADLPPGLVVDDLVDIALELSGMSPVESRAFRDALDTKAALGMTMPRFMRSYDAVDVRGARGMLLSSGARRGPTYTLVWVERGTLFTLSGFGNAAEAVPLASSMR